MKPTYTNTSLPPLPLDLSAHKRGIALAFAPLLLSSCILPLVLYFSLIYATSLNLTYVLAILTAIFGLASLYSLIHRTTRLTLPASTYRPLTSTSRWTLDLFHWNFLFGFIYITLIIFIGVSRKPPNVRMVSLPLPLLMIQVSTQLILVQLLRALAVTVPFRISSSPPGKELQSGCGIIAEDIVAVDGGQGVAYREAWQARYHSSAVFRQLLARLDWAWGATGLPLAVVIIVVIFAVKDQSVGFGLAWSVPWIWSGIMTLVTIAMAKSALRRESTLLTDGAELP